MQQIGVLQFSLVIRIIVCLLLCLVVQGQSEHLKPNGDKTHPKHANTPATMSFPAVDSGGIVVINEQRAEKDEQRASDQSRSYFRRLFSPENLPNIVLSAIGIVGVVVATYTLFAINRQAREMRHQRIVMRGQLVTMRRQLREMHDATEAAIANGHAALANWEAVVNSERPWVFVEPGKLTQRNDPWNTRIEIHARNKGRTPAEVIAANCVETWLPYGHTFVGEAQYGDDELTLPRYLVTDGEPLMVHYLDTSAVASQQRADAIQRDLRLYVIGRVVYRDLISGERHETRLCFFFSTVPGHGLVRAGPRSYNLHT